MSTSEIKDGSQVPSTSGDRKPHPRWLGAALLLLPLSLLGELLIARTHHRPLGAATFATAAVLLWVGMEFVSRRMQRWMWALGLSSVAVVAFRVLLHVVKGA